MKLGIIGSGYIVKEFLPGLAKLPFLTVSALMSTTRSLPTAKQLAAENRVPFVTDSFDVLCSSGIDTIYVAVPNDLHLQYAADALERGLHVIVEKPMGANAAQTRQMAELAKEKNCFLFEAITTLHLGNYKRIAEILPKIGRITGVKCDFVQYSSRYEKFLRGETPPAFDPNHAGGALMDLNLYNINFVLGLFGVPKSATYEPRIHGNIDTGGVARLEYDGFTAVCTAAKDQAGEKRSMIHGTEGTITVTDSANFVGAVHVTIGENTETVDDGGWKLRQEPEFRAFAEAIEKQDFAFRDAMLEKSISVAELLNDLRAQAGIRFPMD